MKIVIDTNVLLAPYNIGKKSLQSISLIYKTLIEKNQLVIPNQVAREFAKHRASKLVNLITKLQD